MILVCSECVVNVQQFPVGQGKDIVFVITSWRLLVWLLPVSQRRNDKPFSAAQELVLVHKAHICDVNNHLVRVLIKVEATLLQPLKVAGASDMEPALE